MKTNKTLWIGLLLIAGTCSVAAQQVTTLYFLENAPMRHMVNPAFQPVSDGYVNFSPLGYTGLWIGNNSLTMNDAIFNLNGTTVTGIHPDADRAQLLKQFREVTLIDGDLTMDLFSFGFRHKEKGYVHIGIMERMEAGTGVPKDLINFALDGGMKDLGGVNTINLTNTFVSLSAYTEVSGGYSYQINDQWTVGGKLKLLLGQTQATMYYKNLTLDASAMEWHLKAQGQLQAAAPVKLAALPDQLNYTMLQSYNFNQLTKDINALDLIKPQGYGAGIDFGFAYKPHPQVQITAAINDLGFVTWKGVDYSIVADTSYIGIETKYSDYANAGNKYQFDSNKLTNNITASLEGLTKGLRTNDRTTTFTRMLSAKLNVGADANFCHNILGLGVVSKTRYYGGRFYEEVTIGGAVRPCNWFNLAVSYSLINNGKYSNIGAGLSFMPYDGINLTLAMDYIPTSYACCNNIPIPYKTKGINAAMGFSIVWGTNHKKEKVIIEEPLPIPVTDSVYVAVEPEPEPVVESEPAVEIIPVPDTPKVITREIHTLQQQTMKGIQFELGKFEIRSSSFPILDKLAKLFIEHPEYSIEVQGHTDNTGSDGRNAYVSKMRAQAVKDYLVAAGVPANRLTVVGYGASRPVDTNETYAGRAKNRRVEFYVSYDQITTEIINQ